MIVTSSVALLMLRSAYGAYQIAKLLTGLISMKWSQLHATLLMDRCNYVNFGQIFFFCLFRGQYPFVLLISDGFLMHFWKGALVGSHKGSCRIYKTTGMNFSPFFPFFSNVYYITLYVMLKLLRLPFFALAGTSFGTLSSL